MSQNHNSVESCPEVIEIHFSHLTQPTSIITTPVASYGQLQKMRVTILRRCKIVLSRTHYKVQHHAGHAKLKGGLQP
jgi:hypothetical protein